MIKSTFIGNLRGLLQPLDKIERDKCISYYEEIIEDYKESGLTEEDAISKIGTPEEIASSILKEQDNIDIKIPSLNSKILNLILLILGFPLWGSLLLAAALLIFSAYILIWCIPFTTGCISVVFFFGAIISIIGCPLVMFEALNVGIIQLGVGITLVGFSILLGFATIYLSKKFLVTTKNLTCKILKSFKKKVVRIW